MFQSTNLALAIVNCVLRRKHRGFVYWFINQSLLKSRFLGDDISKILKEWIALSSIAARLTRCRAASCLLCSSLV